MENEKFYPQWRKDSLQGTRLKNDAEAIKGGAEFKEGVLNFTADQMFEALKDMKLEMDKRKVFDKITALPEKEWNLVFKLAKILEINGSFRSLENKLSQDDISTLGDPVNQLNESLLEENKDLGEEKLRQLRSLAMDAEDSKLFHWQEYHEFMSKKWQRDEKQKEREGKA